MVPDPALAADRACERLLGAVPQVPFFVVGDLAAVSARLWRVIGETEHAITEFVILRVTGAWNRVIVVAVPVAVAPLATAVVAPLALVGDPRDRNYTALARELFFVKPLVVRCELTADRRTTVAVVVGDE